MVNANKFLEKILQNLRFKKIKPYIKGDVLDFGGNEGELKRFVNEGEYFLVNYDHTLLDEIQVDTIVCCAVIEHMEKKQVYDVFNKFRKILKKNGLLIITTPTKKADFILKLLANLGLLDKKNIMEHKYYWDKQGLFKLASDTGFNVKIYKKFQLGLNQFLVLSKIDNFI